MTQNDTQASAAEAALAFVCLVTDRDHAQACVCLDIPPAPCYHLNTLSH